MKEANFYYFFKNTVRKNYLPDMQESSNAMLTFPEVDKIHAKAPQFICNDFLKMKIQNIGIDLNVSLWSFQEVFLRKSFEGSTFLLLV